MTKKMLIDAAHPEEVRVALIDQGKVEDFDFESASRKPLRGNIYLARVTRVEPSLQAAFIEYGGNRHGFLAFSEIHPDYYQIPVSDRQILQEAEAEEAALAAELELMQRGDETNDDGDFQMGAPDSDQGDGDHANHLGDDDGDGSIADNIADNDDEPDPDASGDNDASSDNDEDEDEEEEKDEKDGADDDDDPSGDDDQAEPQTAAPDGNGDDGDADDDGDDDAYDRLSDDALDAEQLDAEQEGENVDGDTGGDTGGDNELEDQDNPQKSAKRKAAQARAALFERYKEAKRKRARLVRSYKIQEVVKRRQILLIQVVKEERGNKGAALTTYLSLAGRYCVLMPNTARGGGISRKIPSVTDRRRLRRVVDALDLPQGMGLIIRTAGSKRTKVEVKRDYDYLIRLWESIRTLTLKSIAPCLVYEEANLIKRAIRDLYDKDISNVLVEGEAGYREAKDFMKMLMPSHAKNVQPYKDSAPIFLKHGVENQLDGMYQPSVRLKSGGYIVIHQTEALVAIDVNSGRSTRERNIELTALKTNVEAAHEAARQFRLRDLAGLIVIDFIDMEEQKNNRKVEKALKDALKADRARIQTGRISAFGLLEMSRQRRRSGIVDGTTHSCPTCAGAGVVRSNEMAAVRILRSIEGEAISGKIGLINIKTSFDVSLFILNHKRDWLKRIEDDNGVSIEIIADATKVGDQYDIEKSGAPRERIAKPAFISADQTDIISDESEEPQAEAEVQAGTQAETGEDDDRRQDDDDRQGVKKKRRRRRKRKDAPSEVSEASGEETSQDSGDAPADDAPTGDDEKTASSEDDGDEKPKRRRRRGRRGGRRNRRDKDEGQQTSASGDENAEPPAPSAITPQQQNGADSSSEQPQTPAPSEAPPKAATPGNTDDKPANKPKVEKASAPEQTHAEIAKAPADIDPPAQAAKKPVRKGWWQRVIES